MCPKTVIWHNFETGEGTSIVLAAEDRRCSKRVTSRVFAPEVEEPAGETDVLSDPRSPSQSSPLKSGFRLICGTSVQGKVARKRIASRSPRSGQSTRAQTGRGDAGTFIELNWMVNVEKEQDAAGEICSRYGQAISRDRNSRTTGASASPKHDCAGPSVGEA